MSLNFFPEQEQVSDEVIVDLYNKKRFCERLKKNPTPTSKIKPYEVIKEWDILNSFHMMMMAWQF